MNKIVSQIGGIKPVQTIGPKPNIGPMQTPVTTVKKPVTPPKTLFRVGSTRNLTRGVVGTFSYAYWKHDPYPLILCCGPNKQGNLCGVNVHYLTLSYVKSVIKQYCDNPNMSYSMIRANMLMKSSYRAYKPLGIRGVRIFDGKFLAEILGRVKSYNPAEIDRIRQEIQTQIRAKMQPTADEMTAKTQPQPNNQDQP